jgi:hypothetical protein
MTTLSYYYDGLSETEVQAAMQTLLSMGQNAQRASYKMWFELSRPGMDEATKVKLDMVEKIDVSNAELVKLMVTHYRYKAPQPGMGGYRIIIPFCYRRL